ncbi:MAG TPA: sugar ABC transporter permease [Firmicutes bacterium]|nr:sugar ABC transporter permease [Bacillota bacterium]
MSIQNIFTQLSISAVQAQARRNGRNKDRFFPWLTVAPAMAIILSLMLYPLIYNLLVSFKYLTLINFRRGGRFIGLSNYIDLFRDSSFYNSLGVSFVYVVLTVTLQLVLALIIALFVYRDRPWLRKVTTLGLLLPRMMTPVSAALVWRFMLNYETGIINYLLSLLNIPRLSFLTDPFLAILSLTVIGVWQHIGFDFLLLVTGLMAMPNEILEAAQVDGANWWERLRYVILPVLKPVMVVVILFGVINSFQVFDIVYMTTGGGPAGATQVLGIYLYRKLFLASQFGPSAAISVVLLFISLLISVSLIRVLRREEL